MFCNVMCYLGMHVRQNIVVSVSNNQPNSVTIGVLFQGILLLKTFSMNK